MFPFTETLDIGKGVKAHYQEVIESIFPLLTSERQAKIEKVIQNRNFRHAVVMENIYDRGNVSAVLRSAEAFGFANVHIIETFEKFKESQRTTAGADKWLEIRKWRSTADFIQEIRRQKKKLIVTHLDATSKYIDDIDFSQDCALVLGNEKDGVSQEIVEAADERVIIPMDGFVQSFNISVAGALLLYHLRQWEKQKYYRAQEKLGKTASHWLSLEQTEILKAVYASRTLDSSAEIIAAKRK